MSIIKIGKTCYINHADHLVMFSSVVYPCIPIIYYVKYIVAHSLCIMGMQNNFLFMFCICPLCTAYESQTLLDTLSLQKLRVPIDLPRMNELRLSSLFTFCYMFYTSFGCE